MFYDENTPAVIVIIGIRSIFSLLSLTGIVACIWYMERHWDDDGSKLYETTKRNGQTRDDHYHNAEAGNNNKTANVEEGDNFEYQPAPNDNMNNKITVANYNNKPSDDDVVVTIPADQLEAVYPQATYLFGAFGLLTLTFCFHPRGGLYFSLWNIGCAVLVLAGGYLISLPLRTATIYQDLKLKRKIVSGLILCGILLTVASILDEASDTPWTYCTFGMILILLSNGIMWRNRKMGITWDLEGKPNTQIAVQNLGPLIFLFGIFLFWVGTNGVADADLLSKHVPIYITPRAWMAFISGCMIIVPSSLALEFAFDEGSESLGYRLDGMTFKGFDESLPLIVLGPFARAIESPLFYMIGWLLFGLSSFLPFGYSGFSFQKLFSMLICVAIGVVDSALLQPAFWSADDAEYEKYSYVYYCLFAWLATCIGIQGGAPLALSVFGAMCIAGGQKLMLNSRKRGDGWLHNRSLNPTPSVYGLGHPIFVVGWILLCLAMSIPM